MNQKKQFKTNKTRINLVASTKILSGNPRKLRTTTRINLLKIKLYEKYVNEKRNEMKLKT